MYPFFNWHKLIAGKPKPAKPVRHCSFCPSTSHLKLVSLKSKRLLLSEPQLLCRSCRKNFKHLLR